MTDDEWKSVALLLENCWKGELTDVKRAAYHTFLGSYDGATVIAALHRLVRNGVPYLPSVPEIVSSIEADRSVPTFDEAWPLVVKALWRWRPGDYGGADHWLCDNAHPVVVAWVRTVGWERLRLEPVNDPDHGGAVRYRLMNSYNEYVEVCTKRDQERLAAAAMAKQPLVRGNELHKLDPGNVITLKRGRPELPTGDDAA